MKKFDVVLIAILLALSFAPFLFYRPPAKKAVVTVDNQPYKTVDLTADGVFMVKTKYGENTVEIKDNAVSVTNANCADKICVKSGKIQNKGEAIACIPHKLLIEIKDEND